MGKAHTAPALLLSHQNPSRKTAISF